MPRPCRRRRGDRAAETGAAADAVQALPATGAQRRAADRPGRYPARRSCRQFRGRCRAAASRTPRRATGALAPPPLPRWLWLLAGALSCCGRLGRGLAQVARARRRSRADGRHQRKLRRARALSRSPSTCASWYNDPLTACSPAGLLERAAPVLEHLARFRRPLNLILFEWTTSSDQRQARPPGRRPGASRRRRVREHLASEDLFGVCGGDEFLTLRDQRSRKPGLAEAIRAAVCAAPPATNPRSPASASASASPRRTRPWYQAESCSIAPTLALYAKRLAETAWCCPTRACRHHPSSGRNPAPRLKNTPPGGAGGFVVGILANSLHGAAR